LIHLIEGNMDDLLECCLFFTANSLARDITKMGEEEFGTVGLSPSYAFLLAIAVDSPGITQKQMAEKMNMAASTVSRFIDGLEKRGLLVKMEQGRLTLIHATDDGHRCHQQIRQAWKRLYERYSALLGKEDGETLTRLCLEASRKLQAG
jgi:DNA-binding MarR family transcriptional regulator